jgi:ABC-2 type transport system ATP-binding protein
MIKSLARDKGTTVFLCTHQLRYAQEICTKYGLISEGSMLAAGSLDELYPLVFSGLKVKIKADKYPQGLKMKQDGEYMLIDVDSENEIPALIKDIVTSGGKVYHVTASKASLEEIYFALIEKRKGTV